MIHDVKEYPPLIDDFILDIEDKINDHTITVEDSKRLDYYISKVEYPGFLLELLQEEEIYTLRQAVRILRHGDFNFEKENDYPGVVGSFWCCLRILEDHLDRGEKIY
jgi:hypothetical protein